MSRMFRSNSSVGSRSKSSMSSLQDIVNKDYTIEENNNDFSKWNILKRNINEVYKTSWVQSTFNYKAYI